MKTRLLFSLLTLLTVSHYSVAESVSRLIWKNQPLPVTLKPGSEVRVVFPANVNIQVPVPLLDRLNTLQVNPRVVYWTAKESFPASQIIAISDESNEVYLVNVSADETGSAQAITIEDPAWVVRQQPTPPAQTQSQETALTDPPEILLTRHVAKTLYAPVRLMPTQRDIQRVPVNDLPENFQLKRSQKGESYQYEVLGQWQGYGRYITAVTLKNTSYLTLDVIDLRTIRGSFTHIATQHPNLGPAETDEAITTLYLISLAPFQTAVGGTSYGF